MDKIIRTDSPIEFPVVFSRKDAIPIAVDEFDVNEDVVLRDGVSVLVRVML